MQFMLWFDLSWHTKYVVYGKRYGDAIWLTLVRCGAFQMYASGGRR